MKLHYTPLGQNEIKFCGWKDNDALLLFFFRRSFTRQIKIFTRQINGFQRNYEIKNIFGNLQDKYGNSQNKYGYLQYKYRDPKDLRR